MYFAIDPIQPGLPERLLGTLAELRARHTDAPVHCYLLVDAGFDQSLPVSLPWRRTIEASLYDGTRLEGLKVVAPYLLRLPDESEKQLAWLQQLLAACTGKPMLSVLFSTLAADELRAHFKPYLLARTEDSMEWPVRWADTRVLPGLIAAMTPHERHHLLSPFYGWMAIDRQGEAIEWHGDGNPKPDSASFDCWPLDEASFGKLLETAEADAVLSQIDEKRPDLLATGIPSELHRQVSRQLALATRHRIDKAPDRLHFAMLGLILAPGFVDAPPMQAALARIAQGADYQTEITGLPAEFWTHHQQGKTA